MVAEAAAPELATDTAVRISGLKAKPKLNGACGRIRAFHEDKGRYAVEALGTAARARHCSGETLLLKRENLTVIGAPLQARPKRPRRQNRNPTVQRQLLQRKRREPRRPRRRRPHGRRRWRERRRPRRRQ